MILGPILADIVEVVTNLRPGGRVDAYLFGSALEPTAPWADVDILLVCESEADGCLARKALLSLCKRFPIDLLIMTAEEEKEFDFVRSECCLWISRNSIPNNRDGILRSSGASQ